MVESELRKSLSQDVRRLITDRMTNDAFDDVYCELYESSDDRAVSKIASSCYHAENANADTQPIAHSTTAVCWATQQLFRCPAFARPDRRAE